MSGRIAGILANARAEAEKSLANPSRPITPASGRDRGTPVWDDTSARPDSSFSTVSERAASLYQSVKSRSGSAASTNSESNSVLDVASWGFVQDQSSQPKGKQKKHKQTTSDASRTCSHREYTSDDEKNLDFTSTLSRRHGSVTPKVPSQSHDNICSPRVRQRRRRANDTSSTSDSTNRHQRIDKRLENDAEFPSGSESEPVVSYNHPNDSADDISDDIDADTAADALMKQTLDRIETSSSTSASVEALEQLCAQLSPMIDDLDRYNGMMTNSSTHESANNSHTSSDAVVKVQNLCQDLNGPISRFRIALLGLQREMGHRDLAPIAKDTPGKCNDTVDTVDTASQTMYIALETSATIQRRLVHGLQRSIGKLNHECNILLCALLIAVCMEDVTDTNERDRTWRREASAQSCRELFVLSKSDVMDRDLREKGALATLLELIRTGFKSSGTTTSRRPTFTLVDCAADASELVYAIGVLKNASNDSDNAKWLVSQGAVSLVGGVVASAASTVLGQLPPLDTEQRASRTSGSSTQYFASLYHLMMENLPNAPRLCNIRPTSEGRNRNDDVHVTSNSKRTLGQLLVQGIATLRNLCMSKKHLHQFWSWHVVEALLAGICSFPKQTEIVLTACRCLSKLSLHNRCRKVFHQSFACVHVLVGVLEIHSTHSAIVTRTMFILGNIMTDERAHRDALLMYKSSFSKHTAHTNSAIDVIGTILASFGRKFAQKRLQMSTLTQQDNQSSKRQELDGDDYTECAKYIKDAEDVLCKTTRVVANLAMERDIATLFLGNSEISIFAQILSSADIGSNEELVLNTVAAMTNLSFYALHDQLIDPEKSDSSTSLFIELAETSLPWICPLLVLHKHDETLLETVRALANFSTSPILRFALLQHGIVPALLLLLEHPSRNVALTACGVLTNIAQEPAGKDTLYDVVVSSRGVLHELGAEDREDLLITQSDSPQQALDIVISVIETTFYGGDLQMCCQAMQILCNYCAPPSETLMHQSMDHQQMTGLLDSEQIGNCTDIVREIMASIDDKDYPEALHDQLATAPQDQSLIDALYQVSDRLFHQLRDCVDQGLVADDDDDDIQQFPKGGVLARRHAKSDLDSASSQLEPL